MEATKQLFFELIQVAIGCCNNLSRKPSEKEWEAIFYLADKHAVAGVAFAALEVLVKQGQKPPTELLLEWIGLSEQIKSRNNIVNQRSKELEKLFVDNDFRSCVLKGQGTALYYNNPELRQSGDIDLWVSKNGNVKTDEVRNDVLWYAKSRGYQIEQIDIKHSDIVFFDNVPVEVHFLPSWMYNPSTNKKLQKFFKEQSERQFCNYDAEAGFTHTTVDFDLVFSIVHIYRHVFSEGIGLRQLIDYYYILMHSYVEQRKVAFDILTSLKMANFVGGIMWILRECFGMDELYLLCPLNERHGKFLLSEILTAGNFGQYDDRMLRINKEKRFERGVILLKRNIRFLCYYPSEVLCSPFWKLWHWCWRKKKGYL